jgi:methyltransferase
MLSVWSFAGGVLLVAMQRLAELRLSRRHEERLVRQGATEHAPAQVRAMQVLHGSWLVSMLLEVVLWQPPLRPWLSVLAGVVFCVGQALRISAMHALGERWTVRIYTLAGVRPVTTGIYRHLRHPNYLGVVLEIAALPLVHSAWRTALVFSVLNAAIIGMRIRAEERALSATSPYREALSSRPRLWPRLRPRGSS